MAQAVVPSRINVEVLRGNPARLRRERVMRGLFFSAAFLSVVISVGIVVSLAGGTLDFLRKVPLCNPVVRRMVPPQQPLRYQDDRRGHADRRGDRHDRRRSARAGSRAVPGRVRLAPGPPLAEAHPGDARERPQRRDGVLRDLDHQPGPRAEAVRLGRPALQPPVRGDRRGIARHAARRLRGRGFDARGSGRVARGLVRPGGAASGDEHPGGRPGRRLGDHRRDHSSASPGRSARR